MKKFFKWFLIISGGIVILFIAVLLVIPLFVDIEKFKPQIEDRVTQATGRPFALKGNLDLSLFPWAGLSLSDLHLGNPPGFEEKDFIAINSFEVRVKLIPLLFKDIQVKRFIIKEPRIVLIKGKNGRTNWEGIAKPEEDISVQAPVDKDNKIDQNLSQGLPLKSLAVGEFSITNGTVLWIDQTSHVKKEISDLSISLENVSLDQPIDVRIAAVVDKWPLRLTGSIGPIGEDMGKDTLPVDLSLRAIEQLDIGLKGSIKNAIGEPEFDMAFKVEPFSLRKLLVTLDPSFAATTSDPKVFNHLSLDAVLKGNNQKIVLSKGLMQMDQSQLTFSVTAKDFSKPDVTFDLKLNEIDLDRYFPPPEKPTDKGKEVVKETPQSKAKKTDYTPLRAVILNGVFKGDKIKVHHTTIEKLSLKISGKNGVFNLNPLTCDLYQGHLNAQGTFDVQKSTPQSHIVLQTNDIQINPLLKNVLDKDILAGALNTQLDLKTTGDDPDSIKKTFNGNGEFLVKDGAIKGIDLAGMIRNVTAAFGFSEKIEKKPRTDFTELRVPFTINNGIFNTTSTTLVSPLLRLTTGGNANLPEETLDFRVEPKFVGTLVGQGDTQQRVGIAVPVFISGTFASPKFRPDLKNILKQNLSVELPSLDDLKKNLQKASPLEDAPKILEEKAKDFLKGLPFGK